MRSRGQSCAGLEAHCGAVAALGQFALERAPQVVDFLLVDEQVAVARDAELVATDHLHAGKQLRHELLDDADRERKRDAAAFAGTRTMRGSERGACTTARSVSRPKASLPLSAR